MTLALAILGIWCLLAVLVALTGAWLMRGGRGPATQESEALEPKPVPAAAQPEARPLT
ncbi:MAG TPA: hypothetical protein VEL07_06955 [Planctomycetota bacterium]|nr:hypothetical protein [Planctomycetota bacterium]